MSIRTNQQSKLSLGSQGLDSPHYVLTVNQLVLLGLIIFQAVLDKELEVEEVAAILSLQLPLGQGLQEDYFEMLPDIMSQVHAADEAEVI
jgi:hypothetical protein